MGTRMVWLLDRLTPAIRFDVVRTRSRIESMSDDKLFNYGRKRTESAWRHGEKRPLTAREIGELQVAREEWQKRKNAASAKISA